MASVDKARSEPRSLPRSALSSVVGLVGADQTQQPLLQAHRSSVGLAVGLVVGLQSLMSVAMHRRLVRLSLTLRVADLLLVTAAHHPHKAVTAYSRDPTVGQVGLVAAEELLSRVVLGASVLSGLVAEAGAHRLTLHLQLQAVLVASVALANAVCTTPRRMNDCWR